MFASKQAAITRVREILRSADIGVPLLGHHEFLLSLLRGHSSAKQKIGNGVLYFAVGYDGYGGRCFHVCRADGSSTDFSFLRCLNGPRTPEQEFASALRWLVRDQVIAFRDAFFAEAATRICPVSGQQIDAGNSHVDHEPPLTFEALVDEFCRVTGTVVDFSSTKQGADNETHVTLSDPQLGGRWIAFHRERARLRVISARANLSTVRRRT